MNYKFYGWQTADVPPVSEETATEFCGIHNPRELYEALCAVWCEYTCAPRLRDKWSVENRTVGQCSITAFLVQDIFGGKVYGIQREGGNFHCYNSIPRPDGSLCVFDLTSEQFGEEKLCYENNPEQTREVHFAKQEKKERYEYIKKELKRLCATRIFVHHQMHRKDREITALTAEVATLKSQNFTAGVIQQAVAPINAQLAGLHKEVDDIKCKMPNTINVEYPQVAVVNTTPYMGGFPGYGAYGTF